MSLLNVTDLCVDYVADDGLVRAVDKLSFKIGPNEFVGLAGESGSGKSTVAKAILRVLQPPGVISGGTVHFEDQDILEMGPQALRAMRWSSISMVFQSALDSLNPVVRIKEQFQDAHVCKRNRLLTTNELNELMNYVQLSPDTLEAFPHQLSGGMRQRVGIALALMFQPKLLLLDEPTTALDVVVQRQILQTLNRLKAKFGFSVLFITHDLPLLLAMSDTVMIMQHGRLCEMGTPIELRSNPQHSYTKTLIQAMNLGLSKLGAHQNGVSS